MSHVVSTNITLQDLTGSPNAAISLLAEAVAAEGADKETVCAVLIYDGHKLNIKGLNEFQHIVAADIPAELLDLARASKPYNHRQRTLHGIYTLPSFITIVIDDIMGQSITKVELSLN